MKEGTGLKLYPEEVFFIRSHRILKHVSTLFFSSLTGTFESL